MIQPLFSCGSWNITAPCCCFVKSPFRVSRNMNPSFLTYNALMEAHHRSFLLLGFLISQNTLINKCKEVSKRNPGLSAFQLN